MDESANTEWKRILRTLELKAYRGVVDALRAQGTLTNNKYDVLRKLAAALKISEDRCCTEIRRAVNDDLLNTIALRTNNSNSTEHNWKFASARKVPVNPLVAHQTVFTALADNISDIVSFENHKFSENDKAERKITNTCINRVKRNLANHCNLSESLEKYIEDKTFCNHEVILSGLKKIKDGNIIEESSNASTEIKNSGVSATASDYNDANKCTEINIGNSYLENVNEKLTDISKHSTRSLIENNEITTKDVCLNSEIIVTQPSVEQISPRKRIKSLEMPKLRYEENEKSRPIVKPIRFEEYETDKLIEIFNKPRTEMRNKIISIKRSRKKLGLNAEKKVNEITRKNCNEIIESSHTKVSLNDKPKNKVRRRRKNRSIGRTKRRIHKSSSVKRLKSIDTVHEIQSAKISKSKSQINKVNSELTSPNIRNTGREPRIKKPSLKVLLQREVEEELRLSKQTSRPVEVSYDLTSVKVSDKPISSIGFEAASNQVKTDIKPHTFNLIPVSRRLKNLNKRSKSPINILSNVVAKKPCLSSSNLNNSTSIPNVYEAHAESMLVSNEQKDKLKLSSVSDSSTTSSLSSLGNTKVKIKVKTLSQKVKTRPNDKSFNEVLNQNLKEALSFISALEENHNDQNDQMVDSIHSDNSVTCLESPEYSVTSKEEKMPKEVVNNNTSTKMSLCMDKRNVENLLESNSCSGEENEYFDACESLSENHDDFQTKKESEQLDSKNIPKSELILNNDNQTSIVSENSEQLIDIESADIIITDDNQANDIVIEKNSFGVGQVSNVTDISSYGSVRLLDPNPNFVTESSDSNAKPSHSITKEDVQMLRNFMNEQSQKKNIFLLNLNRNKTVSDSENINSEQINEQNDLSADTSENCSSPDIVNNSPIVILSSNALNTISTGNNCTIKADPKNAITIQSKVIVPTITNTPKVLALSASKENSTIVTSSNNTSSVVSDKTLTVSTKSIMKPILPKIIKTKACVVLKKKPEEESQSNDITNIPIEKTKKLFVHSSLQNIKVTSVSNFTKLPNIFKKAGVTVSMPQAHIDKSNIIDVSNISVINSNNVTTQLPLSPNALRKSFKLFDLAKPRSYGKKSVDSDNRPENKSDNLIEIASSKSEKDLEITSLECSN